MSQSTPIQSQQPQTSSTADETAPPPQVQEAAALSTNTEAGKAPTGAGGFGLSRLKINKRRQEGNPIIKYIRTVPYEWDSVIKCDFECSRNCGLLYLSLKYHKLHPGYIETRLNDLNCFQVKVLLALVNVEEPSFLLRDLNMLCYRTKVTLVLCFSVEEAAEYIESFKTSENKNVEKTLAAIQQRKTEWLAQTTSR